MRLRQCEMSNGQYLGPVANNRETGKVDLDMTENPLPTWKKLEEMVDKGKIRNIGVSKYVAFVFISLADVIDNDW